MTFYERQNNAKTTLAEAIDISETAWTVTDGSVFPSSNFLVTCWDKTTYPDPSDDSDTEIVLCTSRSTNVLTVTRAQESTADVAHSNGDAVEMLITAGTVNQLEPLLNTPTGSINGSNTAFTMSTTPNMVLVFLDGQLQTEGAGSDYTTSETTLTFNLAPETGQTLRTLIW